MKLFAAGVLPGLLVGLYWGQPGFGPMGVILFVIGIMMLLIGSHHADLERIEEDEEDEENDDNTGGGDGGEPVPIPVEDPHHKS